MAESKKDLTQRVVELEDLLSMARKTEMSLRTIMKSMAEEIDFLSKENKELLNENRELTKECISLLKQLRELLKKEVDQNG